MSTVETDSVRQQMSRDGFAIVRASTGPDLVARLYERLMELEDRQIDDRSQRLISRLVARDPLFADLATAPWLLALLDELFGGVPHLVCSYGHVKPAGTAAHTVEHSDVAHLAGVPHDQSLLMAKVMVALTPVPADRSPTVLYPGTHRGGPPDERVVATLNVGDTLIFHANIRHSATANQSTMDRVSVWFVYAQPWMRVFPGHEHDPAFLTALGARLATEPALGRIYGLDDPYAT